MDANSNFLPVCRPMEAPEGLDNDLQSRDEKAFLDLE
jgi:hypothetical protein